MDDWSYKNISENYLRTGHFIYNGWANAMLGWQIPYGAFFMHLFGPSFFAVRLSTLPLALGCVVLYYLCSSRFSVRGRNALIGGLTFSLSPLFLPLEASFMTDIAALFLILLCLYMCQQALLSSSAAKMMFWLVVAAGINVAGGSVRQIAWLGSLVMIPSTGWLLRRQKGLLAFTLLLWACAGIAIVLMMRWFSHQPYTVPESTHIGLHYPVLRHLGFQLLRTVLCVGLVLLPILAAWTVRVPSIQGHRKTVFWFGLVAAFCALAIAIHRQGSDALMPWLQHILDNQGIWPLIELRGSTVPSVLGTGIRTVISLAVIASMVAFLAQMQFATWRSLIRMEPFHPDNGGLLGWPAMFVLLAPFLVAYGTLLLPRGAGGVIFDRYLVCILPLLLMLLIRTYQDTVSSMMPTLTLALVILFAGYGVAALHDTFASLRAELSVTQRMQNAGVPRGEIDAGWVANGLAQVELGGHIDNPLVKVPAPSRRPPLKEQYAPECANWFDSLAPAIKARYFLVFKPTDCFTSSQFSPTTFQTWLPPFRHTIYVQEQEAPGKN